MRHYKGQVTSAMAAQSQAILAALKIVLDISDVYILFSFFMADKLSNPGHILGHDPLTLGMPKPISDQNICPL